jgi:hypothetical protein
MASPFSRAVEAIPRAAATARAAWDAVTAGVDAASSAWARTKPAASTGDLTIPAPWQERDPAVLGNRLTPTALAGIIRERNEGHFQRWVDLGAEFLGGKNPHLLAQLGVRRASVSETRFEVKPGKGSNGRGARRAAADFAELMDRWRARQEWDALLGQITMAEWWGRSLHEVSWSAEDAGFMAPERLSWVHPRRLSYACPIGDLEPWTIRIHDPDDPSSAFSGAYGVPISRWHADKFILHETAPLGVQKTGEGLLAGVIWYLLMYEWSWRDLMALVELLGRPGVIGYYAAGGAKAADRGNAVKMDGPKTATPDEVLALTSAVRSVSGSLRAVLSDTTRVEPLKFDAASSPLQLEAIKHIEGLLSKAVNGTTGVTDIVAGSRAAQQVAWMQSLTYWRYDVRRACGFLGDVARRMVAANPARYGVSCPAPIVWSPDTDPAPSEPSKRAPETKPTGDGPPDAPPVDPAQTPAA